MLFQWKPEKLTLIAPGPIGVVCVCGKVRSGGISGRWTSFPVVSYAVNWGAYSYSCLVSYCCEALTWDHPQQHWVNMSTPMSTGRVRSSHDSLSAVAGGIKQGRAGGRKS